MKFSDVGCLSLCLLRMDFSLLILLELGIRATSLASGRWEERKRRKKADLHCLGELGWDDAEAEVWTDLAGQQVTGWISSGGRDDG